MKSAMELLTHTSAIVDLFTSNQPLRSRSDTKLKKAEEALSFFQKWEQDVNESKNMSATEKWRALISWETREDLASCIIGFSEYVDMHLTRFPDNGYVVPNTTNTDVVENIFCQVRSVKNGGNTNPQVFQYQYTLTSVILSQGLFCLHGNASNNSSAAKPFAFYSDIPLRKRSVFKKPKFD